MKSARESDLNGTLILIYSSQKSGGRPLRSFALISPGILLKIEEKPTQSHFFPKRKILPMAFWKPTLRRYWRREPSKNARGHPDDTALRLSRPFNHFKDYLGQKF